jgi:hypothetical protein
VLAVREERVTPSTLEVTTLGMLRELLAVARHEAAAVSALAPGPSEVVEPEPEAEYRSEGRAVLAFHTAALGAYLGFSLQRASGSNDARLTYPLAALGAGVGLGASVVVSEEWDIGVEHAWYLGAGMLWPGLGTLLALEARDLRSANDQFIFGLLGAVGGLSLATAGLSLGDVGDGGAALTHSGGSMGLLLGGLAEMAIAGDAERKPSRGMGVRSLRATQMATRTAPSWAMLPVDASCPWRNAMA